MWKTNGQYSAPGMDYYEKKYHEQILNNLKKKAMISPPLLEKLVLADISLESPLVRLAPEIVFDQKTFDRKYISKMLTK
jgi:hypothetical protein